MYKRSKATADLVSDVVGQLLTLVPNLVGHPFVPVVNVRELVSMRATVTTQRGKAVVQTGAFAVESSHRLAVGELDELWRGQLPVVFGDHHAVHRSANL